MPLEFNPRRCSICGQNSRRGGDEDFSRDTYFIDCDRCGLYHLTLGAHYNIGTMKPALRPFLQCATRQASEAGRSLRLDQENIEIYAQEHENSGIPENIEKFLVFLRNRFPRPG